MKKKTLKLQLSRETLRNLGDRDLKEAAGGAATYVRCSNPCITEGTSCDCSSTVDC
jgi:hypothetical protein